MRRIFLSAVTNEFGSHRRLLKTDINLPQVKVQEQADLVQGGGKLLQTLDSYIRDHCDAVIHLVGREGGNPSSRTKFAGCLTPTATSPSGFHC